MIAYKLLRRRKNGTLGSLYINQKGIIPIGIWSVAESYPTKGYALRPGWHCCKEPNAPHLSMKGRVWCEVEIKDFYSFPRPKAQGGIWFIAKAMKVVRVLDETIVLPTWCASYTPVDARR